MDDRGQIFSDFQNFTGIDDAGRCFTILEQFNWNLQDAVQNTLNQLDSSISADLDFLHTLPPPIDLTDSPPIPLSLPSPNLYPVHNPLIDISSTLQPQPLYSPSSPNPPPLDPIIIDPPPSFIDPIGEFLATTSNHVTDHLTHTCSPLEAISDSKMLNINVEYRSQSKSLVVRDTDSVGRLKELLGDLFELPVPQVELHGWVHKNDHLIRDTDLLGNLHLPKDSYLYILTPKIPVNVTSPNNTKGEGMFKVTVKYLDEDKQVSLCFPADKTVKQLKQDVGYCLSVPLRFQQWISLPASVKFSNKTTLGESGLPRLAMLQLRSTAPHTTATNKPPLPPFKANSSEVESDSETGDMDTYVDEELEEDHSFRSAIKPLMPANSSDQTAGTENFSREFGLRYGEQHPIFYIGSLDNAVNDSLMCKAKERKMLAMYLHHDSSVFTNVFCSQVLCADSLIAYLSNHFITWAWDLTYPSNINILIQTCTTHFGSVAATSISQRIHPSDRLPVVLLISRHRGSNEVIEIIEGNSNLSETISRLIHATEINNTQLEAEIAEETEREVRGRVLAEQDAAYQESLAVDRAKEDSRKLEVEEREKLIKQQEREKQESMSKKLKEEEEKQAFEELLASDLPDEPPSNADLPKSVICIKVRCPQGQTLTRRFYRQNNLADLLNFITSQGHHAQNFKLLTVYPRRDLKQQDPTKTFEDLGLASQETITLEEL